MRGSKIERRSLTPSRFVGCLVIGLLGGLVSPSGLDAPVAAADCEPNEILVNPCRPWVGAASNTYVSGFRNSILHHEARAGRQMDIVHNYHGPGEVLSSDDIALATRPDTIGFFNYKPSSDWASAGGTNTTVNARIDMMAASVDSLGDTKIFLTISHEPENDVSPGGDPACPDTRYRGGSGTTAEYVAMWQNVRARFDALGVDNVVWVMNYLGYDRWDCLIPGLWPGNELVDWVMWDPYPGQVSFETKVGRFYDVLTAASDTEHDFLSKPWGLAEYGYVGSSQAGAYRFYDDILRTAKDGVFPKLRAYINWDSRARNDNRVQYSQAGVFDQVEQDHYNALVNDPFFTDPVNPDLDPPSVELTTPLDGDTISGGTTVSGPAADDRALADCDLILDGTVIATDTPTPRDCTFTWNSTTTTDGPHTLALAATDTSGNRTVTTPITINVSNPADLDPPAPPTALTATAGTNGAGTAEVSLAWQADLADDDLAGFTIVRDTNVVTTVGRLLAWTDSSAQPGSSYTYEVRSFDAAGNASAAATATVTVPVPTGPDDTDPSTPQGLTAIPGPGGVALSWEPATDNVAVESYYVFRANSKYVRLDASQASYTDAAVSSGVRYTYKVYAIDSSGNWGRPSNKATAVAS